MSVSFAVVIDTVVQQGGSSKKGASSDPHAVVANLADRLFASPGAGWYSTGCATGPFDATALLADQVTQLGLAEECSGGLATNNLSFLKLEQFGKASLTRDATNGAVDYQEARSALGLAGTSLDFHLRSWPLLAEVQERLEQGFQDPNLRPLYIGDYEKPVSQTPSPIVVPGVVDHGNSATLYVNVTNNGIRATAFSVIFKIPTKFQIVVEKHSGTVTPGLTANVTLLVNKTSDWEWRRSTDKYFEYVVLDPDDTIAQGQVTIPFSMTGPHTRIFLVESTQLEWILDGPSREVSVIYDALRGNGKSDVTYNGWTLRVLAPDGTSTILTGLDSDGGTADFTVSQGIGTYRVQLRGPNGFVLQQDRFNVVSTELDPLTLVTGAAWVPQEPVAIESAYVDALVAQFDRNVADPSSDHPTVPYASHGDVVPDDNGFLSDFLRDRLISGSTATTANYNAVFVGSNVDHNTLTNSAVKHTLRDWVLAGGSLIVLGSDEQSVQWMQPLYHVGIDTANGGIGVPDSDHPILTTPNDLDIDAYTHHDTVWRFHREEDKQKFTHVVNAGPDQILTVSDPGAFGKGTVLLTSYRAYDLGPAAGPDCTAASVNQQCPGLLLLDNFLTTAYRGLYLDYGPPIPESAIVAAQSRIGSVYHPEMRREVEIQFLVYVFG